MPHGWDAETVDGVDLCLNRIHGTAIIVAAGDAATGGEQYRPQFRYDHPGVIRSIVEGHMDTLFDSPRARPIWEVWFLLHHLTTTSVRAEVSRPSSINSSGLVTEWLERILLPEESFGGSGARRSASGPRESPPVEVAVRRRVV
jgi:hypothetical protein